MRPNLYRPTGHPATFYLKNGGAHQEGSVQHVHILDCFPKIENNPINLTGKKEYDKY